MKDQILEWMVTGDVGQSSKAMACAAAGLDGGKSHPYDPSDFNRCLMLVHHVPMVKLRFKEVAALSDTWGKLIERWDELEKCFIDEVGFNWSKRGKRAIKTYALMKEIGC